MVTLFDSHDTRQRVRVAVLLTVALVAVVAFYAGWTFGNDHGRAGAGQHSFSGTVTAVNEGHNAIVIRSDKGGNIGGLLAYEGVSAPTKGEHVTGVVIDNPNVVYVK